ncbi:unnamed protein product [Meloidogyne enterolobii]|uniref:Uncharacterized protein n=1 Tax=Meloidogyne enterolobii TaxID=390850 RepID=A0ACB0Y028_MELEN
MCVFCFFLTRYIIYVFLSTLNLSFRGNKGKGEGSNYYNSSFQYGFNLLS